MIRKIFFKTVLPLGVMAAWFLAIKPLCFEDGVFDWRMLWLIGGIPYGLRVMFARIPARGYGLAGELGAIALNFLLSGLIGGFVAIIKAVKAVANLFTALIEGVVKFIKSMVRLIKGIVSGRGVIL